MNYTHKTVLLNEAVEALNCSEDKLYIDATAGGGGHSLEIAKKLTGNAHSCKLYAFDVDKDAIAAASEKLKNYSTVAQVINASYAEIPEFLEKNNISKITGGVLFDLGASSHQLTTAERGFSFSKDAPLDMRFNTTQELTAKKIINVFSEKELADIFYKYGEERYSRRISKKIVEKRKEQTIETTCQLADIVKSCIRTGSYGIHPATRVFQAIRIFVNSELQNIETTLQQIIPLLDKGARIVVISFHSLEDRLVKNIFRQHSIDCCNCPKEQPVCSCGFKPLKIITKKPIIPSDEEIENNPSARSAKMRVAEHI